MITVLMVLLTIIITRNTKKIDANNECRKYPILCEFSLGSYYKTWVLSSVWRRNMNITIPKDFDKVVK